MAADAVNSKPQTPNSKGDISIEFPLEFSVWSLELGCYSTRRATTGSTLVALRAGM